MKKPSSILSLKSLRKLDLRSGLTVTLEAEDAKNSSHVDPGA